MDAESVHLGSERRMGSTKLLIGWRAVLIAFGVIGLVLGTPPDFAMAQSSKAQPHETLDIGDEPGRVSTEEVTITDGPFARQAVLFRSTEPPGTLVVHTSERFIYLVQGNNRALRYGIGVGRERFQSSGLVRVSRKSEWPDWRPPSGDDRSPAVPPSLYGGWLRQSYGCSRPLPWIHGVPRARHQPARNDRSCDLLGLLPASQRRHHRSLRLYDRVPLNTKVVIRPGASL